MSAPVSYYVKHKKRLLWEFNLVARSARSVTEKYFNGNAQVLLAEARHEFENLIPQLPDVGGQQPFHEFVVFTGMLLAVYRVSKAHGQTVEQTGIMIHEIGKAFLKSFPHFLLRMLMPIRFSRKSYDHLRERAIKSHVRQYPDGYVFNFIEGDSVNFDYGVDYLECASCKFLAKQDASEIAPYLCPVDILYSDALGWGLIRTQTIAEGADRCDFRFKRGGKTNVAVPEALRTIIAQNG